MFSSGFSGLKSLGDQIAAGAREFEATLAQPLIPTSLNPSTPPRQSTSSPSTAANFNRTSQNAGTPSPRRTASSSSQDQRSSVAGPASPLGEVPPQVAATIQSASQLADSALSSLRMSFKKGRASLDAGARAARTSIDSASSGAGGYLTGGGVRGSMDSDRAPFNREGSPSIREREEPPATSTPSTPTPARPPPATPPITAAKPSPLAAEPEPYVSRKAKTASAAASKKDPATVVQLPPSKHVEPPSTPPVPAATPSSAPATVTTPATTVPVILEPSTPSSRPDPTAVPLPTTPLPINESTIDDPLINSDPLLRSATPDDRFALINTADTTPVPGPSRVGTPAPTTVVKPLESASVGKVGAAPPPAPSAAADEDEEEEGDAWGLEADEEEEEEDEAGEEPKAAEKEEDGGNKVDPVPPVLVEVEEHVPPELHTVEEATPSAPVLPPLTGSELQVADEVKVEDTTPEPSLSVGAESYILEPPTAEPKVLETPPNPDTESTIAAPANVESTARPPLNSATQPSPPPAGPLDDKATEPGSASKTPLVVVDDVKVVSQEAAETRQVEDDEEEDGWPSMPNTPVVGVDADSEVEAKADEDVTEPVTASREAPPAAVEASEPAVSAAEKELGDGLVADLVADVKEEVIQPAVEKVVETIDQAKAMSKTIADNVQDVVVPETEAKEEEAEAEAEPTQMERVEDVPELTPQPTLGEKSTPIAAVAVANAIPARAMLPKPQPAPAVDEISASPSTSTRISELALPDPNLSTLSPAPVSTPSGPPPSSDPTLSQPVSLPAAPPPAPSKELAELQALKEALDRVARELLPGSGGVGNVEEFERELRNLSTKTKGSMEEIGRLTAQLDLQKERMEEVRDTHRLEEKSQSSQVKSLNSTLADREATIKSTLEKLSKSDEEIQALKLSATKSSEEHERLKTIAKEEEEKRTKALSLLRALRQKLVKAEKEKEDLEKAKETLKQGESSAQETLKLDRARFDQEIISLRAAQEQQLNKLRASFDREVNSLKAQHERETTAKKGQYELDTITVKAVHTKELQAKDARIAQLEKTVRELTTSRDSLFDQVQLRTAEIESSSAHQESLQGQTGELQYELKDARDRASALQDELEELKKTQRDSTRDDSNTRRLLIEAEKRHDQKVRDLEARTAQLEKDRQETEEEMGRNLQDRLKEVERMRQQIVQKDIDYAESVHLQRQRDAKIEDAEAKRRELETKLKALEGLLADLRNDVAKALKAEAAAREELSERQQRASEIEQRLEEVQSKESSLRSNNKVLREELRKLQSGVLLSEKQRQPGVGYFASYQNPAAESSSALPLSPTGSDDSRALKSPPASIYGDAPAVRTAASNGGLVGAAAKAGDEAVNFEYLRNVILQFLERPEMRAHLVSVLGVILHFTPAESRRLAAKAT